MEGFAVFPFAWCMLFPKGGGSGFQNEINNAAKLGVVLKDKHMQNMVYN